MNPNKPRYHRRPISDQEWRERFDPHGVFEEKVLERLDKIFERLDDDEPGSAKHPEPQSKQEPRPPRNGGTIDL